MTTEGCAAAAYVCDPADGHHWVSRLSQEHIWVQTCSLCAALSVDIGDHDARLRIEASERIAADIEAYADDMPGGYGNLHAAALIARGAVPANEVAK